MEKNTKWALLMLLCISMSACTKLYDGDDPTAEIPIGSPGKVYTPEGKYNLNVVYYVPADVDSVEFWHYRLSGITKHAQEFYKQNMTRQKYNKTFGLVVNENKDYIKIHYIKSKRISAAMAKNDIAAMTEEVKAYFEENPTEQVSNHFLVYLPKYEGAFMHHSFSKSTGSTLKAPDLAFAFVGCDNAKFNIKYFASPKARKKYLEPLGRVLYELGHAFLLTNNMGKSSEPTFSLWGNYYDIGWKYYYDSYATTPDRIRLTPTDAMRLNQIQVFNQEHTYKDIQVTMEQVALTYVEDTIRVEMSFRSSDDIQAAIIYNDPWRSTSISQSLIMVSEMDKDPLLDTGYDAITYYVDYFVKEGDLYKASFVLPWEEMIENSKNNYINLNANAEIRFSFVGKGGMPYPHPGVGGKGTFEEKIRGTYVINKSDKSPVFYTPNFKDFKMGRCEIKL